MRKNLIHAALSLFLCYPFLYGAEKKRKPVIAFVGTRLDNIPEVQHNRINLKFHNLFSKYQGIVYKGPNPVRETLGPATADSVIGTADKAMLKRAATQVGADHIFFATLENQSQHADRIMLVGTVVRYDLETDQVYRMEVLKYLDDFGIEIARVNQTLLSTIDIDNTIPFSSAGLAFGAIMVLGLLMLLALKINVELGGGEQSPGGGGTGPPGIIG